MNRGIVYGIIAYVTWGLFPIYWKTLQDVPALETLCHRTVWSLVFLGMVLAYQRRWQWVGFVRRDRKTLAIVTACGLLLGVNWFTFIWSVNAGYVVEASLGYFMTPLVSVTLAVLVLGERPRWGQWAAVGLASAGVLYLTLSHGSLPWIALTLALTFGTYGLLKKRVRLAAVESLSAEMAVLTLPALAFLLWQEGNGVAAFGHAGVSTTLLLLGAGVVTSVPLLFFAASARLIPLTVVGLLQYIAPTLQFLLGVFLYGEPFTTTRLIGFGIIWLALAIFTVESIMARRTQQRAMRKASASA